MHQWACKKCGVVVDVIRRIDELEVQPDAGEAPAGETSCEHDWERQISGGQAMHKGRSWGHGKGYWVLLLSFLPFLGGCVSLGPADWQPSSHVAVMRACSVSCHPNGMGGYDAITGSCTCTKGRK
jgi:hypothetical protein